MEDYEFEENYSYDIIQSAERIVTIVLSGAEELNAKFKDLKGKGKFEVLLFNSLLTLKIYQIKYPYKYQTLESVYFDMLETYTREIELPFSKSELNSFIKSRLDFYQNEYVQVFIKKDSNPGRLYSLFYITPLSDSPSFHWDIEEVNSFEKMLKNMISKTLKSGNEFI